MQRFMMRPIGLFTMAIFVTLLWGSPVGLLLVTIGILVVNVSNNMVSKRT